jgi:transposase
MAILSKDSIEKYIIPHLSVAKRGKPLNNIELMAVMLAILYRLKTGCQWKELPMREFWPDKPYSYKSVFYHFNRWSKNGSFRNAWIDLLRTRKQLLDLSSVQLDGSLTRAHRGGEAVGFQGRRQDQCTNFLAIADSKGVIIALSAPISGEHHDLFEIEQHFKELLEMIEAAEIATEGLFLNADAGFDSANLREVCQSHEIIPNFALNPRNGAITERDEYFDSLLYEDRKVIEPAFSWLDSLKALLIRFETTARNWFAFNLLGILVAFIRSKGLHAKC